jgi:magnesium transporter
MTTQRADATEELREDWPSLGHAERLKRFREIMHTHLIAVPEETSQKDVADVVRNSRLLAVPVLDKHARMVGIVTVDDIVDVVEEESARAMQNMGGTAALHGP